MKKIVFIIVLLISLIANTKVFLLDKYMYVGEKRKARGSDYRNDVAFAR